MNEVFLGQGEILTKDGILQFLNMRAVFAGFWENDWVDGLHVGSYAQGVRVFRGIRISVRVYLLAMQEGGVRFPYAALGF